MTDEPVDPEVLAILNEMKEAEPKPPPAVPMNIPMAAAPVVRPMPGPVVVKEKSVVDMELVKRAALAAVVAYVMFYPGILDSLYAKIPIGNLMAFDSLIRVVLLAVVLYLLMWKLNI